MQLFPRPTSPPTGMRGWLDTFANPFCARCRARSATASSMKSRPCSIPFCAMRLGAGGGLHSPSFCCHQTVKRIRRNLIHQSSTKPRGMNRPRLSRASTRPSGASGTDRLMASCVGLPAHPTRVIILRMFAVKDDESVAVDRELDHRKSLDPNGARIRCPRCGWSPRKEDKWFCECGNEWNTFDTGGVCPACLHQWTETQCLSCSGWSAHSDWYAT